MSISKYVLPIVSNFLSARSQNSKINSQSTMLKVVTEAVKKEISMLVLKIVFGLVATGVLIYSLIVLGQHLQFYLLLYNNGTVLSVLFFSIVSVVCVFLLLKLFHKKNVAEEDPFLKLFSGDEAKFRLGKIYEQFMSGMAEGIREIPDSEAPVSQKSVSEKLPSEDPNVRSKLEDYDDFRYSGRAH